MMPPPTGSGLDGLVRASLARNPPSPFLSDAAIARVADVAAALPGEASAFFGFECRLGGSAPESDFLACITADGGGAEVLAERLERDPPGPDPFWPKLARFCRSWADPARPFLDLIENIWLEFDLAGMPAGAARPVPAIFTGTPALVAGADPALLDHACDALDALSGYASSRIRRDGLRRVLAALPPGGHLFQLGVMLSRGDPRIRICVRGLDAVALDRFLARLGPPDDARRAWLADLGPRCAELRVGLDADAGGIGPRLGIECYCGDQAARWIGLSRMLLDQGLALPAEIAAIDAWSGLLHRRILREDWPAWLDAAPDCPVGSSGGVVRSLHHVKLTWSPHHPVTAKAYLAARLVWFDDAALADLVRARLLPTAPV